MNYDELPRDLGRPDGSEFVGKTRLYRCLECGWLTPRADLPCPTDGKTMAFIGWMVDEAGRPAEPFGFPARPKKDTYQTPMGEVHADRDAFDAATQARAKAFRNMRQPESVKNWKPGGDGGSR